MKPKENTIHYDIVHTHALHMEKKTPQKCIDSQAFRDSSFHGNQKMEYKVSSLATRNRTIVPLATKM